MWKFMNYHSMCSFINTLSGCELATFALLIAISISENLDSNDTSTLGDFFTAVGANLIVIATNNENNCQ